MLDRVLARLLFDEDARERRCEAEPGRPFVRTAALRCALRNGAKARLWKAVGAIVQTKSNLTKRTVGSEHVMKGRKGEEWRLEAGAEFFSH